MEYGDFAEQFREIRDPQIDLDVERWRDFLEAFGHEYGRDWPRGRVLLSSIPHELRAPLLAACKLAFT